MSLCYFNQPTCFLLQYLDNVFILNVPQSNLFASQVIYKYFSIQY